MQKGVFKHYRLLYVSTLVFLEYLLDFIHIWFMLSHLLQTIPSVIALCNVYGAVPFNCFRARRLQETLVLILNYVMWLIRYFTNSLRLERVDINLAEIRDGNIERAVSVNVLVSFKHRASMI